MKRLLVACLPLLAAHGPRAQEIVTLPHDEPTGLVWEKDEKAYFSDLWNTRVVTNVSAPTLRVFRPRRRAANGAAVIVAPGGGFHALSIDAEGNDAARWLADRGFTAFVLKYRLLPTGEDGVAELSALGERYDEAIAPILPHAIADGASAVAFVRTHAERYDLDTEKIGLIGFSAGGTVTLGVALTAKKESRPDFIVPVYPSLSVFGDYAVPRAAPPMLVICAADDALGLAKDSVQVFSAWRSAGIPAGLHMYARGDHGFGMRKQGLPSDRWIERFHEWAMAEGF